MFENRRLEEAIRRNGARMRSRWWDAFASMAGGVDAGVAGDQARDLMRLYGDEVHHYHEAYPVETQADFASLYEYLANDMVGPVVVILTDGIGQDGWCFQTSVDRLAAALQVPPKDARLMIVDLATSTICIAGRQSNHRDETLWVRLLRRNPIGTWESLFEDDD